MSLVVALALIGWWLIRDTDFYLQFFGLNGDNTVYDLRTARVPVAVYWRMYMCRNGECLTHRDWACGYENDSDLFPSDEVTRCFEQKLDSVPVWTKLDQLRKECGHRNMVYTGNHLDAKRCAALGGARLPSQSPW